MNLLDLLSTSANQRCLALELEQAAYYNDDFWGKQELPGAQFPFVQTCLVVGASFDPNAGYHAVTNPDVLDNDFGSMEAFTLIDITNPTSPKIGFAGHLMDEDSSILTPTEYLQLYEGVGATNSTTVIGQLSSYEIIGNESFCSLWPSGELRERFSRDGSVTESHQFPSSAFPTTERPKQQEVVQGGAWLSQWDVYKQAFLEPVDNPQTPESNVGHVVQIFYLSYSSLEMERKEGEFPVSWSKLQQSNDFGPNCVVVCALPLLGVDLPPLRLIQGLSLLVHFLKRSAQRLSASEVLMVAAKCFALADGSQHRFPLGPLPATLYSPAAAMHRDSEVSPPPLHNLECSHWTLVIVNQELRHYEGHPDERKIRYAFVRPQPGHQTPDPAIGWVAPESLTIASMEEFLRDAVTPSDPSLSIVRKLS